MKQQEVLFMQPQSLNGEIAILKEACQATSGDFTIGDVLRRLAESHPDIDFRPYAGQAVQELLFSARLQQVGIASARPGAVREPAGQFA
jgi:hypothetical protein